MAMHVEEEIETGLRATYQVTKILKSATSHMQQVDLVDLEPFGRTLLIDGLVQSAHVDEFVYHEALVHPALLMHKCPKTVYIGGGGEGSTAREVLRHKSVEKCVMVDIDPDVVNFCRDHLEENAQAFKDPRLDLRIDDARAVLETQVEVKYDVIIMDLDDPLEGGPCYKLYTTEFYAMLKARLNPGGIVVTQSSAAGIKSHRLVWSPVHATLRSVFPCVRAYKQAVYSFLDEWGWNIAADDESHLPKLSADEVDSRIADRIDGELRFLDGESYNGLFCLSKVHRATLASEEKILSTERGVYSFLHSQGLCVAEAKAK